jgi:hypothetical protein
MATERLSMRKSREILRLKWVLGRSHREAERACSVGLGTVSETVGRARVAGLDWAAVERLTDDELEARLYPKLPTVMPGTPRDAHRLASASPTLSPSQHAYTQAAHCTR